MLAGTDSLPYVGPGMLARAVMLGIVVAAVGCDKTGGDSAVPDGVPLDLSANPTIVFHVFGDRTDVRMMPALAVRGNAPVLITLDNAGWREFDEKYLRPGMSYATFRNGQPAGRVTVVRGMWDGDPLYTLPACRSTIPMAVVTLSDTAGGGTLVSQYAWTGADSATRPRSTMHPDSVRAIARRIGEQAASSVDISPAELDSLDFRAIAIASGTQAASTIVVTFVDPKGGDLGAGQGNTQHVMAIADDPGTGYVLSYTHAVNGDASRAEFRGFSDHFDINGDGVSEIFLDASLPGRETTTRVLAWRNGVWREVFAARESWCLDAPGR